jgi:hypothetical protein|tara:strand:- start:6 stop:197 length:192 start_codon:yes stop_codon:yes gene_type:complete
MKRGANKMKTFNSINLHDILKVEMNTEVLNTSGGPFTITKYRFTDTEGNVFTVNAFLKEEQDK